MPTTLPVGKLSNELLAGLLKQIPIIDESLLISPKIGCDAAGLELKDNFWAVTMDPITFASEHAPRYSIAININDIVCLGCKPKYFLSTILLPEGMTDHQLQKFWKQLIDELNYYQIQVIGGHTEVTKAVNIPVIVGQMIGKLAAPEFFDIRNTQAGDRILLWHSIAIEGTALIAHERYDELTQHIPDFQLDTMCELMTEMGLCILPAGEKLFNQEGVVCLHDPTEGGLATALHEIADACDLGLEINKEKIPVLSETQQLSKLLKFDPLGLIASGCLLIVCKANVVDDIMQKFDGEIIAEIGRVTKTKKRLLIEKNKHSMLPRFDQDEVARALTQKL